MKAKAEAGDADSEVELGLRYDKGEGVVKDQVEAVKWFRKAAAEQNFALAQYNLGVCYQRGDDCRDGVEEDDAEAAKWYRKAAEQNDAAAQYNLGIYYERGDGVVEDWIEAYNWLSLAARQGHEAAKKYMTVRESKLLTPEQTAQGQKRAREFKPR